MPLTPVTIPNPLPTPAFYFPPSRGRYEVAPGLSKFGKDFGAGPADSHVFQLDHLFPHYRQAKENARVEALPKYYVRHELAPDVEARVRRFIADRLTAEHPRFFRESTAGMRCVLTGELLETNGRPYVDPFDALAMQVQEDLAVVSTAGDRHWLSAIHLCFPNHWAAGEKIGRAFAEVHEPVAGMAEMNRRGGELVRLMVSATEGLVRFAWGLTWDDELNHHPAGVPGRTRVTRFDPEHPRAFLRVERQTIWGFPDVGASLFTIRTYLYDCAEVARNALHREALLAAVHSMSEASLRYKGLWGSKDDLLAWLSAQGTQPAPPREQGR